MREYFGVLRPSPIAAALMVGALAGCGTDGMPTNDTGAETGATRVSQQLSESVGLAVAQDTSVRVSAPNKNFGGATSLDVNRALVQVSAAALSTAIGPNDYVEAASLRLTLVDSEERRRRLPRQLGAHRLLKAWTESGATWSCAVDANPANSAPNCSGPTDWNMLGAIDAFATSPSGVAMIPAHRTGVVALDVTSDVRAMRAGTLENHGWLLKTAIGLGEVAEFGSRESGAGPHLSLTVKRCSPAACDDGNACTADSCDAVANCVHTSVADGSACSDSNACTQTDSCQAGSCVGENPVTCAASDQCHAPGTCDAATGACSNPPVADGSACNDGNACTVGDACQAGTCTLASQDICAPGVIVINEVESSGGVPGDWVELYNASSTSVDLSGFRFKDNDDSHAFYVIPAGTTIAAGGFLVIEEAAFGFGLGGGETARLYGPSSNVPIDSYAWTAHAPTTYGRCPDGTGAFATTTTITKGAPNDCSPPITDGGVDGGTDGGAAAQVVLNEVESSGGAPGDWAELYNAGTTTADVSGFRFKDNDDSHAFYVIPAGTTIPAGGYLVLEEAAFGFGLGGAETARLYAPSGDAPIDSYAWTAHAPTTYGRCPNGTGAFATTTTVTKGTANDCSVTVPDGGVDGGTDGGVDGGTDGGAAAQVVLNEVESSGGAPGDWAELYNAGTTTADVSGFRFKDNDDTHAFYVIPAGTTIPPGGFLVLEEAAFGFGLGGAETARLYAPTGDAPIDSYAWTAHAPTTYGRCPDGTGAFSTTTTSTKGTANDCGAPSDGGVDGGTDGGTGGLAFAPWPGANNVQTVDTLAAFGGNLSGLTYQPETDTTPAVLWAVQNNPSVLFRLEWDGTQWVPAVTDGWEIGKTLVYPNGSGVPDSESVTKAAWDASSIYVATERNNAASGVSRLSILRFDTSGAGSTLTATAEWDLTSTLPVVGANLGLEAITWVPDGYLVDSGFIDESTGQLYNPLNYGDHAEGVFFVGIEASGIIYAFVLDQVTSAFQRVATISSGQPGVMGIEFDRDLEYLWAYCDDTCGNRATILTVNTDPLATSLGLFSIRAAFERPSTLPNLNNEGIAIAPESACTAGQKSFFWTDDSETGGHSLRRDSIPCGPLF